MRIRFTPIAVAVFFSIGGTASALASGGSNGGNGSSSGNRSELIGDVLFGLPGTTGNGGDVENTIQGLNLIIIDEEVIGAAGLNGNAGSFIDTDNMVGVFSYGAGGGVGGNGGASVIAGISIGGSAGGTGYLSTSESYEANGGGGGFIESTIINIDGSIFHGQNAFGGKGGDFITGDISTYIGGGGGRGGNGGGSVSGGISIGGSAGFSSSIYGIEKTKKSNGGSGGNIRNTSISIFNSEFFGANGGDGGSVNVYNDIGEEWGGGAGGGGGDAGASLFGGVSIGGSSGYARDATNNASAYSIGGKGGFIDGNNIYIVNVDLYGKNASGGDGGSSISIVDEMNGAGGHGGNGGGSVFGGISTGGSAGVAYSFYAEAIAAGGDGGTVARNKIYINDSEFYGGNGGNGGNGVSGGNGGNGGGSVFGGVSTGGAGGYAYVTGYSSAFGFYAKSNGGDGGHVENNSIEIYSSFLDGGNGGDGGNNNKLEVGTSGIHGGSVLGGVSTGGSGGYIFGGSLSLSNGGKGGNVKDNSIYIENSTLKGFVEDPALVYGNINGGSVFGGISRGGDGGSYDGDSIDSYASGGDGGDVVNNNITISGESHIYGDIYGGYSIGGSKGDIDNPASLSVDGKGGFANLNTITLRGAEIKIDGSIYGGLSVNGGLIRDYDHSKAFSGNTLNLDGYKGTLYGIHNIENYNWNLPAGVFNNETIIEILGTNNVKLDNTKHTIAMYNDGNRLNVGDELVMISKAEGGAGPKEHRITQGHFLVYDATLEVITKNNNNQNESKLVLSILGKEDSTSGEPAGTLPESSKKFLVSRTATMATLNQGADMVSDYLVIATDDTCGNKLFGVANGGSHRTNTGSESHIKLHDVSMAFGGVSCLELQNKSTVMLSAFVGHGRSNYDSYNHFTDRGDVPGWGDVQYTGAGAFLHMNVAGTGSKPSAPAIGTKDGLYLNAALSAGRAKTSFDSTLLDSQGVRGKFDSKSTYVTAMVGAGYAWKIDEKQWLDFYGRYNWSHLGSDSVMIGNDRLSLGTMKSSRLSFSARYHYAIQKDVTPYVGVAFEREFTGHAYGHAYDMSIDRPTLKGSSGVVEFGVNVKPSSTNKAWTVNMGVQGEFGNRRGVSAGVGVKYLF